MNPNVPTARFPIRLHRYGHAAVLFASLITPISAQEPTTPVADAPVYQVGDTWTFSTVKANGDPGDTTVQTVMAVSGNQTRIDASKNGEPPYEVDLNNQGDMFRSGDTTWEPSIGWLSFPMRVGKSWSFHDLKRTHSAIADIAEDVKVVAFERVLVRAGAFDAYKIVIRGVYAKHLGGGLAVQIHSTYWYAPSVKAIVKFETGWTNYHNGNSETTVEMTAFSLAQ
ncbi:hypothetical protein [Paraburkholderia sp. J94]|uniref:hypothetical protein n=1 Tax=Paraburkholderia sp. J94 TaxID=2805441 RepID=UPI002AAFAC8B|nr:hypothetical protein [Paraburkholderia sp. J94]